MMRLVQMIWQVLMILISVYIGWLFIDFPRNLQRLV